MMADTTPDTDAYTKAGSAYLDKPLRTIEEAKKDAAQAKHEATWGNMDSYEYPPKNADEVQRKDAVELRLKFAIAAADELIYADLLKLHDHVDAVIYAKELDEAKHRGPMSRQDCCNEAIR